MSKFSFDGCTIINTVINSEFVSTFAELTKFDERRIAKACCNIIKVTTDIANVTISVGSNDFVEAHFYGESDGNVDFNFIQFGEELTITARLIDSTVSNNCRIDLLLPKRCFTMIFVKVKRGNVVLAKEVETTSLIVNSKHGNIDVSILAKNNIAIDISTKYGNVNLQISNCNCYISTSTKYGRISRNTYANTGKHLATGRIETKYGNIIIK